jgi:hypothetical protein
MIHCRCLLWLKKLNCVRDSKKRPPTEAASDAALRSGKFGPIKAECFADLTNRRRVEVMARSD